MPTLTPVEIDTLRIVLIKDIERLKKCRDEFQSALAKSDFNKAIGARTVLLKKLEDIRS